VIHTEKYPVKPMFIDEAVLQIEMSAKQFLVFLNAKTERVNVIYRRKNGDFGLIEPTFNLVIPSTADLRVRGRNCSPAASC
jgi:putative sigma-54 modulation protein